jgi:hypothetical protein
MMRNSCRGRPHRLWKPAACGGTGAFGPQAQADPDEHRATAVIHGEWGFAAPLARGIFCLSRAVGIRAHAWEQTGR